MIKFIILFFLIILQNIYSFQSFPLKIALTRDYSSNLQLINQIKNEFECYNLPCITFEKGKDYSQLITTLPYYDGVILTSPQAATIFSNAFKEFQLNYSNNLFQPKIISLGKGTSKIIREKLNIEPIFEPSEATAECLSKELPKSLGLNFLNPTSNLSKDTILKGLSSRGFKVTRLISYETKPEVWTPEEYEQAEHIDILTLASPSAAKVWADRIGVSPSIYVAAIGSTTYDSAKKLGFSNIYSPSKDTGCHGIPTWINVIKKIKDDIIKKS